MTLLLVVRWQPANWQNLQISTHSETYGGMPDLQTLCTNSFCFCC